MSAASSARKRIWQLEHHYICPVLGLCLTENSLRRIFKKIEKTAPKGSDYDIHHRAVDYCKQRNRFSERIQKTLEQRFQSSIQAYRQAKTRASLLQQWQQSLQQGLQSQHLWAAMTHPCADEPAQAKIFQDIHLKQHQLCRTDSETAITLQRVQQENATLTQELARIQKRVTQLIQDKNSQIQQLRQVVMRQQSKLVIQTSRIEQLQQQPPRDPVDDKDEKITQLKQLIRKQQENMRQLKQQAKTANPPSEQPHPSTDRIDLPEPAQTTPASPVSLQHKTILCVGGRQASVVNYRQLIEQYGAQYLHHDGGLEDNLGQLNQHITAADLVICQTGCISHKAYWKVKNLCKRTGKQCVYVKNPSRSSLNLSLQQYINHTPSQPVTVG